MKNILIHYSPDDTHVGALLKEFLRRKNYNVLTGDAVSNSGELDSLFIEPGLLLKTLLKVDLAIVLISQTYVRSASYQMESEMLKQTSKFARNPLLLIVIDDSTPQYGFEGIGYSEVDKKDILNGNFKEINRLLAIKETEMYQTKIEETAEKESKKAVIERITDSLELKEVISDLKNREKFNKRIAMGCYSIGTAGIIIGAFLAYFSVSNIPSDKNSYYYIYIGLKNLAIIGLLILCSRYTFNIGKIFMEEGVKQADRLHAIHYGKFFLESFREKLSFEEMKDLFKDWNMDNKPSPPNNPDPMAADPNKTNTNGGSEASTVVDLIAKLTDLLSSQKK